MKKLRATPIKKATHIHIERVNVALGKGLQR